MDDGDRARSDENQSFTQLNEHQSRAEEFADPYVDLNPLPRLWAGIIANRSSGSGRGRRLVGRLTDELAKHGIGSRVAWSPTERHTLVKASSSDRSCRCLVAAGGDGTVAALLNELPNRPIAILPAGTENLTAAHFQHRRNERSLASTIAEGKSRRIDLGQANGRRFILMAGFGFDGDVVSRHHRGRLGTTGGVRPTTRAAYVEPILRSSFSYKFPPISVRIDDPGQDETLSGTTVFLFNLPRYALGLPFAPEARDDDGWLDLLVFRKPGPFQALYYLWRVLRGNHLTDSDVIYRRVRRVTINADEAVPVQLDGDPGGILGPAPSISDTSPSVRDMTAAPIEDRGGIWHVEVIPSAAEILVPACPPKELGRTVSLARDVGSR